VLAGIGAAVLLLGVTLALLWPSWWAPGQSPAGGRQAAGVRSIPLSGELRVRVWSKTDPGKRGLELGKDFAALPVRNQEQLRLEARLSAPAHVYLLWLDSDGRVTPLYPWNERKIVIRDAPVPPPLRLAQAQASLPRPGPDGTSEGYVRTGKSGLETIVRLASRAPLPAEVNLARLIGKAPVTPVRDLLEFAVRGGDEEQPVAQVHRGEHRGP